MVVIEKISSKLEGLTDEEIKEVEDFIDFLVHRSSKRSSLKNGDGALSEPDEEEILTDEFAAELQRRIESPDLVDAEEVWGKFGI